MHHAAEHLQFIATHWTHLRALIDTATPATWPPASTTDYTRQQQLAAGQPECTECGDTGACNGGPCAHPDAAPSR